MPLTINVINQSLVTGIFPDELKIAKVKPLHKKGDKSCLNNYRPISLLPTISKVFERVMHSQIYEYFNTNNLLSEQQYGFRSQHSTELAAIKLVDSIISNLDDKRTIKTPISLFLDLSKAFDTLNFSILLNKLEYYGIVGVSLNLIKSYLTNRYQYVKYENQASDLVEIKTGIPQGSILGPLFFSIYINDLVNSSTKFTYLMYADDTTISFNLEDFPVINKEESINNELEKLNIWLKLNKLTLNVAKTKSMIFRKRRHITPVNLSINGQPIDSVSQFCFLGIMLDEKLTWKNHTDMVMNKLSRINGVLHRLKYIYPENILLTIYNSLFLPHINYGSLVWGTTIDRLQRQQKKAIRSVTRSKFISHTEPLMKELNLLKVKDLFSLKILKFLHKLAHDLLPPYFNIYRHHLIKIETPYTLRPHPLPALPVAHVFAESCLLFQLVAMKNEITLNDNLILRKLDERSHSHAGFSIYVKNSMIEKYNYNCTIIDCHICGR